MIPAPTVPLEVENKDCMPSKVGLAMSGISDDTSGRSRAKSPLSTIRKRSKTLRVSRWPGRAKIASQSGPGVKLRNSEKRRG